MKEAARLMDFIADQESGNRKYPIYFTHVRGRGYKMPEEMVPEFLHKGDLVLWIGDPKARKSNIIQQMAVCLASGKPFLGFDAVRPLRVAIFDAENRLATYDMRLESIIRNLGLDQHEQFQLEQNLKFFCFLEYEKAGGRMEKLVIEKDKSRRLSVRDEEVKFWQGVAESWPADIYIVDPLRLFHDADENNSGMGKIMMTLKTKVFKDKTIILVHHTHKKDEYRQSKFNLRKDPASWSNKARGSGGLTAHADLIVCQEYVERKEDQVILWNYYGRDVEKADGVVLVETSHKTFTWVPGEETNIETSAAYDILSGIGGSFASYTEIVESVKEKLGCSTATAYKRVKNLKQNGLIYKTGGRWFVKNDKAPDLTHESVMNDTYE